MGNSEPSVDDAISGNQRWRIWTTALAWGRILPTDQRARDLWHNTRAARLFVRSCERLAQEQLDSLSRVLGVLWDVDELRQPVVRPGAETKRLIVPLAMLLVPDLLKQLRTSVSQATDKRGHAIKELGHMASKIFRQFIGEHTSLKTDLANSANDKGAGTDTAAPEVRMDQTTDAFQKGRSTPQKPNP